MPPGRTAAQKRRKKRNKTNEAAMPQGGAHPVEGHEPTLKTPALQRELEDLAKNGIELELREVEQPELSIGDKKPGSDTLLTSNDIVNSTEETKMTMPNTTGHTSDNNQQLGEPVNEQNWPGHTVRGLHRIGDALEKQASTGATVKNALVMTGAVAAGTLVAQGLWKLGAWAFAPKVVTSA